MPKFLLKFIYVLDTNVVQTSVCSGEVLILTGRKATPFYKSLLVFAVSFVSMLTFVFMQSFIFMFVGTTVHEILGCMSTTSNV